MFQKNNFGEKVKKAGDDFKKLCELAGQIDTVNLSENEKTLVEAMVPLVTSIDMASTALESLRTWTAHNFFIQSFAERGINNLDDAAFLADCLAIEKQGGSDAATAMLSATKHLINVTNETSLEDLKKIAKLPIDVSDKGTAYNTMEDSVIAAAMERNLTVDEVVSLAESFLTKTGNNRLILAYVKKWGVNTPAEAKSLYEAIRGDNFGGKEAKESVVSATKEKNISLDEFKPEDSDFVDFVAKLLTEIFTDDASHLKCFLWTKKNSCPDAKTDTGGLCGIAIIEREKGLEFNNATELRERLEAIQKKGQLGSIALKNFLEKNREKFETKEGSKIIAVLEEFIDLQSSLDS